MTQLTEDGPIFVKKDTRFLTNSPSIVSRLNKCCVGGHEHVALQRKNKTHQTHIYPVTFCRAICVGVRKQKQLDAIGWFQLGAIKFVKHDKFVEAMKESEQLHEEDDWGEVWDDVTGRSLRPEFLKQTRKEEIGYSHKMNVYTKVCAEECISRGVCPGAYWTPLFYTSVITIYIALCVSQYRTQGKVACGTSSGERKKEKEGKRRKRNKLTRTLFVLPGTKGCKARSRLAGQCNCALPIRA